MKELPKGGNALLARSGKIQVELNWVAPPTKPDCMCFVVTSNDKVLSDDWFVFYNQLHSPLRAVELSQADANKAEFLINLDALPNDVQKCVFAVALGGESNFRHVPEMAITGISPSGEKLIFKISDVSDEQALILTEIYRHSSGWKMRAVGQGFRGGLEPLAKHYGVDVNDTRSDELPTPPAAPPPPPPVPEDQLESGIPSSGGSKLFKVIVPAGFLMAGLVVLIYFYPSLRQFVDSALKDPTPSNQSFESESSKTENSTDQIAEKQPYVEPQCNLSEEKVFEHYHALGQNYIKITKIVNSSNQIRTQLKSNIREPGFECTDKFKNQNRQEIERLEKLPITAWIEETTILNICAGVMIQEIETNLDNETRPALIQKLVQKADRARNLESDLTNIARDLAYYKNKTARLIEAYKSNLEVCLL